MSILFSILQAAILICLCYGAYLFLLAVPLIKKTHYVSNQFEINPLESNEVPEIQTWLQSQNQVIESCGFERVGYYTIKHHSPNVSTYFSLFRHPQDGLAATAVWMESGVMKNRYLEISQAFDNQHGLTINNSPIGGSWKRPDKEVLRFPWIQEFTEIYRLHQKLKKQKPDSFKGLFVEPDKEIEFLKQHLHKENQFIVNSGMYSLSPDQSKCIPSWSGTVKLVLKNTFPGKEISHFVEERHNRKLADS